MRTTNSFLKVTTSFRYSTICMCAAIATGCAGMQGYPKDPESGSALTALQAKYFGPESEARYENLKPDAPNYEELRRAMRDDIVLGRMRAYDIEFSLFQRSLNSGGNYISVGSDLTALVLNGLGATTGNAATKSALSAASGGVIGAQGVVNKDLFYQKTVPAIIAQMEANRAKVKLAIFAGLKQPDAEYALKRADSDLSDLNDAGSLPNAVSNITQQSTQQKNDTQSLIEMYQSTTSIETETTTKLQSWLYPAGNLDRSRFKTLQNWLTNNSDASLRNVPSAVFVSADLPDKSLEAARKRAITELSIK
ncbi:MAG: hypothetical protein WAW96_16840 [Alphaproteobacteria bacterium]